MAMRRACSYQATIRTPQAPGDYSEMLLTIQQKGQNLINKTKDELTINETSVIVNLTQQETAQFAAGVPAHRVSEMVGFNHYSAFFRIFKRIAGRAPTGAR